MSPNPAPGWLDGGPEPVFAVHHPADRSIGMAGALSVPHGDRVDRLAPADGERCCNPT